MIYNYKNIKQISGFIGLAEVTNYSIYEIDTKENTVLIFKMDGKNNAYIENDGDVATELLKPNYVNLMINHNAVKWDLGVDASRSISTAEFWTQRKLLNYGKALLKATAHTHVTRKVMAEKLGLSTNYFYDLCTGTKRPGVDVLENAAFVCEVDLSTLIKWGEE